MGSSEEASTNLSKDLQEHIESKKQLEKERDDYIEKLSSQQDQMNTVNLLHSEKVKEMTEQIVQINLENEKMEIQIKTEISKREEEIKCFKDQLVKAEENH